MKSSLLVFLLSMIAVMSITGHTPDIHPVAAGEYIIIETAEYDDSVEGSWREAFIYPAFTGGTDAKNLAALNKEVSEWIESSRIYDDIKEREAEEIEYAGKAFSYTWYKVLYDGADYKIIGLYSEWFGGGPHGNSGVKYMTFDAKTGEKYKIDYFIKDIPDYKRKLNNYLVNKCVEYMEENPDTRINFYNAPLKFDGTENYYYDRDNHRLIIEYGEYALSDFATHFETIIVRINFLRDDTTATQKILGEWYLDRTADKYGNEDSYMDYLWESGAVYVYVRFDEDGGFYKRYSRSRYDANYDPNELYDLTEWKREGTYTVNENTISLQLNTDKETDSILFWRNGEKEIAYFNPETETIEYRTNWSKTNNQVVYCYFK